LILKAQALAEKQYISPIRLFEHLGIEYTGEPDIARIKKHLAAEFNQSKDGFIEIEEYTYNRNDVMEEIEKADFPIRIQYHQRVWEKHFLLSMLEKNEANFPEVKDALDDFQHEPSFDEFFSPYFAGPFNIASRACINNNSLADLGDWFAFESFLLPEDRELAFTATRVFLDESVRIFRNVTKENYKTFKPQLIPWLTWGWHQFLNNLPHEYDHYKEEIAVALINLTVSIQKSNKADSRDISNDLMLVKELSPELQRIIVNNDKAYNSVSTSSGSGNYWWAVWVVFVLIRILATGGCN
jgi:hypothetical protein